MFFFSLIIFTIFLLLSVAFFTMFERKILGISHFRLGPNKVMLMGLGQPFSDLIKLFIKMDYSNTSFKKTLYAMSPIFMVGISLLMWYIFPHQSSYSNVKFFMIMIMIFNSINIFFFLFPGWSSGSFYSMVGSYRASAQSISYEGIFFFSFLIFFFFMSNFNSIFFSKLMMFTQNFFLLIFCFFPWLMSILAESNRSPFDLVEGESELVSGFNTEYEGGLFSLIFLSEYMSMLFLCFLTSFFFFMKTSFFFIFFSMMLLLYVWVRVSFPRLRYDKLMMISWKSLMFFITSIFILYMMFICY